MRFRSGLDFDRTRRTVLLYEHDEIGEKYKAQFPFAKFQKIAGLSYWGDADLRIISIESAHWAADCHRRKRQEEQIPVSVLESCRGVSYYG